MPLSEEYGAISKEAALLCIKDKDIEEFVTNALKGMGYHITHAETGDIAIETIKVNLYNLIIVEEGFDGPVDHDRVISELKHMASSQRRRIFLSLLGDNWNTGDEMLAFTHSVNLLINKGSIGHLKEVLSQAIDNHEKFYRVFNTLLSEMGKT